MGILIEIDVSTSTIKKKIVKQFKKFSLKKMLVKLIYHVNVFSLIYRLTKYVNFK